MRTISQETPDSIERGTSILVVSETFSGTGPASCSDLLVPDEASEAHVLCITITRSPEDHLVNWRRHGNLPDQAAFVNVDASSGSKARFKTEREYDGPEDVDTTVDQVSSPENLTRFGVRTAERLDQLTDQVTGQHITVCFDSITSLLQYVDVDEAFRFLHVLTDRLTDANVSAHFHMDPDAHDDEAVETITTLFDDVWAFEDSE